MYGNTSGFKEALSLVSPLNLADVFPAMSEHSHPRTVNTAGSRTRLHTIHGRQVIKTRVFNSPLYIRPPALYTSEIVKAYLQSKPLCRQLLAFCWGQLSPSGHVRPAEKKHNFNPLNPELNPICYLLALLGAHHFLHVSRIRVKLLTFR